MDLFRDSNYKIVEEHINNQKLDEVMVVEPQPDCDVLERLGVVGVRHVEEGVVAVALAGESVGTRDGLVRPDVLESDS